VITEAPGGFEDPQLAWGSDPDYWEIVTDRCRRPGTRGARPGSLRYHRRGLLSADSGLRGVGTMRAQAGPKRCLVARICVQIGVQIASS
jgi:hypothetical protein